MDLTLGQSLAALPAFAAYFALRAGVARRVRSWCTRGRRRTTRSR